MSEEIRRLVEGVPEKGLLLVAVRADDAREVQARIKTVLAIAATYDKPPDTTAAVWCKALGDLKASDLDRLAGFISWDRVRDLNVGDVVGESDSHPSEEKGELQPGATGLPVLDDAGVGGGALDQGTESGTPGSAPQDTAHPSVVPADQPEEEGMAEAIRPRTDSERLALMTGFAEAINMVDEDGMLAARKWLRDMLDSERRMGTLPPADQPEEGGRQ